MKALPSQSTRMHNSNSSEWNFQISTVFTLPPFALIPAFRYPPFIMASPLDPNDLVTLEELTIANMWEWVR